MWDWGKYLGWWAFSFFLVWAFVAIRDVRWDLLVCERVGEQGPPLEN